MGVVYRARQRSADRIVALKVIRPDRLEELSAAAKAETLRRFLTEAQAAARLEHDHIVTVFDVGEIDGQPFYSMRYVPGRSLADLLREGPLENRLAASLMLPIAKAVHFAHTQGILHRDLKPRNILLEERRDGPDHSKPDTLTGRSAGSGTPSVNAGDRPFVADFGLAKLTESTCGVTHTGQVMGTPEYMSPEQAQDASRCTEASDIYSLGATLYELVTGRPPFRAATPDDFAPGDRAGTGRSQAAQPRDRSGPGDNYPEVFGERTPWPICGRRGSGGGPAEILGR
jgi:serine/threonine-protein kinase